MSERRAEVRLIVGRYEGEDSAVIAGCLDRDSYDVDGEWSDRWAKRVKEEFAGPALGDYEWREVVAYFDADALDALFEAEPITGELAQ